MAEADSSELMSPDRTRETVAAFLAALAEAGDHARFLAEGVTFTATATGEVTRGREAVATLLAYLHRQAFVAVPVVRTLIATADQALVEAELVGTHIGEFAGVAPTGRAVRVPYAAACDLAAGEIVAIRAYLPLDALVRQIRQE